MRLLLPWLLAAAVLPLTAQAPKKPFDVWALNRVAQVSDPQLSPDGLNIAFVVKKEFLSDNSTEEQIYLVPLDGGEPKQLTFDGKSNSRPRWAPDSTALAFLSDQSGSTQVWIMDPVSGEARQITNLATDVASVLVSPDGERIIYASRVFPECGADDSCNASKLEKAEQDPVQARLYDKLLYRHWTEWDDGRRSRLFALSLVEDDAQPVALTPAEYDVPPFSLGGPDAYDVSPDGREVCFTMDVSARPERSTNTDLYTVSIEGGRPVRITQNPAADLSPVYSPDGRFIAYRAQERPGYESDRFELNVYTRETGEMLGLTETLDRWVSSITWSPDSSRLFFTAEDQGREPIFTVRVGGGGVNMAVYGNATHGDVQLPPDGRSVIYTAHSGTRSAEIFQGLASGGQPRQLTHFNDELFDEYASSELEEISWTVADGAKISGFLVKPPDFDFEKKYPLLTLVHGGPQSAWGESWSHRWNAQVFAGAGFVVFMPNPRGSTGYGQAFTDAIQGDWGGKPFEDIMSGIDHVIARPYVDATGLTVAGASYGGYMVNWMLGSTDRFRAAVSHAGVYDLRSFFGATEELWFPLWDLKGAPWDEGADYETWSPSKNAAKFSTPTLVVHGALDFRVPDTQGMQMFTALQTHDVPSQFLYYPDEGHWVNKPHNRVRWYETVLGWLKRWTEQ